MINYQINWKKWKRKEDTYDYNKYIIVWKKYLKLDMDVNLLLADESSILSNKIIKGPQSRITSTK